MEQIITNPMPLKQQLNLKYIDFLRGIAILLVIICHVSQAQKDINTLSRGILDFGKIGVQLFFFLSAYTLCLSMSTRKEQNFIRNFYLRRFFRIAPLYYLGILTYFFVSRVPFLNQDIILSNYRSYTISNVLDNVFFIHGLIPSANNSIVPGGWSIGTEMLFYLIFPFLFMLFSKMNVKLFYLIPFLALFIAIAFSIKAYQFDRNIFRDPFYYNHILNQLPVFIIGMSYFFLEKSVLIKFNYFTNIACFILLISSSFILMHLLKQNISLSIFLAAISFVFLMNLFKEVKLSLRLLQRIGQLSFSIYIFHFLFAYPLVIQLLHLINGRINPYILYSISLIITFLFSIFIATISENVIEKRGVTIGKSIINSFKR